MVVFLLEIQIRELQMKREEVKFKNSGFSEDLQPELNGGVPAEDFFGNSSVEERF